MQLFKNLTFKPGEYIFGTNILPLVHSGKRESFNITLSHFWPNIKSPVRFREEKSWDMQCILNAQCLLSVFCKLAEAG